MIRFKDEGGRIIQRNIKSRVAEIKGERMGHGTHIRKWGLVCGLFGSVLGGSQEAKGVSENKYLDMDLTELMNITITSVAKKEQRLVDAPAAVFVITQEDIRKSGVTHIADALAMAPGLHVAKISSSKWSISSRGFTGYTSNKLLILIDGRSVYSPAYSGTFWDAQHVMLEDVERIEVVRGPGGSLWGANAVNGVINIITKSAVETEGGLLRAGIGNQERSQGAARYGVKLSEHTYGRGYVTCDDRDANRLVGDGSDAQDEWKSYLAGFRVDHGIQTQSDWTVQGEVSRNDEDQLFFPDWSTTPPFAFATATDVVTKGANILGRVHKEIARDKKITVQAYYDYSDRVDTFNDSTFSIFDIENQFETAIGNRNALTLGGGYRIIDGSFGEDIQVELEDTTDNLFNVFVQDEITLIDETLLLTLGAKWEHNDYTGHEWQPGARVLLKPEKGHSLWGAIARAVRTPSLVERQTTLLTAVYPTPAGLGATYFLGNENVGSEHVIAYEAGYRWQTDQNLSFDLALFYNDYSELQGYELLPKTTGFDLAFANVMHGESYGVEAAVDWMPAPWLNFMLAYSYLEMDFSLDSDQGLVDYVTFLETASPQHQASLRSSLDLSEDVELNLWLRYVDEIIGRSSENLVSSAITLDSYFIFDANLIWRPNEQLEIMVAGQNLFSDGRLQYVSEFTTLPTEIEPSVYVKCTYTF